MISHASRCGTLAFLLALVVLAGGASLARPAEAGAVSEEYSAQELGRARAELDRALAGASGKRERVTRIAEMALLERPAGALAVVVEQAFQIEGPGSPASLYTVFERGDAYARRRILDLYWEQWSTLGRGSDPHRLEMVRRALASDDRPLRHAAARLAGTRPLHHSGHTMVDASLADPELTLAALYCLATNRDWRPIRWAIDLLSHPDPRLREGARFAIQSVGREAAERLRERLDPQQGEPAPLIIDALLLVATGDDAAVLYRWLEAHGPQHPELSARVTRALAEIEIGSYRPEFVEPPELTFFVPESGSR